MHAAQSRSLFREEVGMNKCGEGKKKVKTQEKVQPPEVIEEERAKGGEHNHRSKLLKTWLKNNYAHSVSFTYLAI